MNRWEVVYAPSSWEVEYDLEHVEVWGNCKVQWEQYRIVGVKY